MHLTNHTGKFVLLRNNRKIIFHSLTRRHTICNQNRECCFKIYISHSVLSYLEQQTDNATSIMNRLEQKNQSKLKILELYERC